MDLFGRYFGDLFTYEEVEQIIEKRDCPAVNRKVQKNCYTNNDPLMKQRTQKHSYKKSAAAN